MFLISLSLVLGMAGCTLIAQPSAPPATDEEEQEVQAAAPTEEAEVVEEESEIEIPTLEEEITNGEDENMGHEIAEHGGGFPVVPLSAEVFAGQELWVSFDIEGFLELDFILAPDDAARFLARLDFNILTETDDNSPLSAAGPLTRIYFGIGTPLDGGFQASFHQEPDLGLFTGHDAMRNAFTTFLIQPPGFFDSLHELVLEFEQYGVPTGFA